MFQYTESLSRLTQETQIERLMENLCSGTRATCLSCLVRRITSMANLLYLRAVAEVEQAAKLIKLIGQGRIIQDVQCIGA
jgi:hypothetical protein